MHLFAYLDEIALEQQMAEGMVKRQLHPHWPLAILNYTQKAQFSPHLWSDCTDRCRGLIYNTETMGIVSRPFVKFWNYQDTRHPETMPENFPPQILPEITRKVDGSLGVGYPDNGRLSIATRGSFVSDQAAWASGWMYDRPYHWPTGYTPLFEIVYPENRIVVDYKGWSGLTLLALVNNETGDEAPRWVLEDMAKAHSLRLVERFDKPVADCVEEDDPDEEGYVATWHRGGTHPLRVKIKYATYRRLHKIMTGTSAIGIWEMLRDGKPLDTLYESTPQEFRRWAKSVETSLRVEAAEWQSKTQELMAQAPPADSRRDFAEFAKANSPYTPFLFAALDGKALEPMAWKMVRPKGNIRPFVSEEEYVPDPVA